MVAPKGTLISFIVVLGFGVVALSSQAASNGDVATLAEQLFRQSKASHDSTLVEKTLATFDDRKPEKFDTFLSNLARQPKNEIEEITFIRLVFEMLLRVENGARAETLSRVVERTFTRNVPFLSQLLVEAAMYKYDRHLRKQALATIETGIQAEIKRRLDKGNPIADLDFLNRLYIVAIKLGLFEKFQELLRLRFSDESYTQIVRDSLIDSATRVVFIEVEPDGKRVLKHILPLLIEIDYGAITEVSDEVLHDAEEFSKWVQAELEREELKKNRTLTTVQSEQHRRIAKEVHSAYIIASKAERIIAIPQTTPEFAKQKWVRNIIADKLSRAEYLIRRLDLGKEPNETPASEVEVDDFIRLLQGLENKWKQPDPKPYAIEALETGILKFLAFMSERAIPETAGFLSSLRHPFHRRAKRARLLRETSPEAREFYSFIARDEFLIKKIFQVVEKTERLPEKYDTIKNLGQTIKQNLRMPCAAVLGSR